MWFAVSRQDFVDEWMAQVNLSYIVPLSLDAWHGYFRWRGRRIWRGITVDKTEDVVKKPWN